MPFASIHTYITNFWAGVAVSTVSLWIMFQFFEVDKPLRQAIWMSVMVSFVNLLPYVTYFFPIPLLAYLLSRRGSLSASGIIIIIAAWLGLNMVFYTGLANLGFKYTMQLPGWQVIIQSINKVLLKR
ncbi:MAG: hypothetical protein PHH44_08885 [bacterium]|nr:hypothetical protein [bacterium]